MKPIPLRKLKEQTEVVEESPVRVAPSSWLAWGEAAPLYFIGESSPYFSKGEIVGYWNVSQEDDTPLYSDALPIEFFNHEIFDYDISEEKEKESARAFVERFGVPFLPPFLTANMNEENYGWYSAEYMIRYRACRKGVFEFYRYLLAGAIEIPPGADDLAAIRRDLLAAYEADDKTIYRKITDDDGIRLFDKRYVLYLKKALHNRAASFWEVDFPIVEIQLAVGSILKTIDETIEKPNEKNAYRRFYSLKDDIRSAAFIREAIGGSVETLRDFCIRYDISIGLAYELMLVNSWAYAHKRLSGVGYKMDDNPAALVSAVCLQFIEAMDDPTPWRRCAKCGRLFKYQINHNNRAKKKGHEDAAYCSKRCADAGRQSAYRAGIRAKSGV